MFCCQHGDECISMDLVCDGKADCPLGSDEGNRCSKYLHLVDKTCKVLQLNDAPGLDQHCKMYIWKTIQDRLVVTLSND